MKKVHLSKYGHGMAGIRLATILLGSITLAGNAHSQDAADIEQAVSQAMDNAGNDPVSIEAAIRGVMDQVKPTAAGMKQIAATAMRKVAGFNQRGLMASVSQATAKAALSQALSSGVNPLDATASVTDGLVSAATDTIARRGGNSVGTAKAVSQATMQAVVETAGGLGIPVTAAANAAAFGAMNASLDTSVDYGGNTSSMARDVTAGLATGAIEGAQRLKADPGPGANAALTGAVDSIFGKAEQNNIDPEPLVKAAQAGFNQALTAANLNASGAGSRDSGDETNTDIIGALLEFGGSLNLEFRPDKPGSKKGTWWLVFNPDPENPIDEEVIYSFQHDGIEVKNNLKVPELELGPEIDETEVGQYNITVIKDDETGTVLFESNTKLVSLINTAPLEKPVSPSS